MENQRSKDVGIDVSSQITIECVPEEDLNDDNPATSETFLKKCKKFYSSLRTASKYRSKQGLPKESNIQQQPSEDSFEKPETLCKNEKIHNKKKNSCMSFKLAWRCFRKNKQPEKPEMEMRKCSMEDLDTANFNYDDYLL